MISVINNSFEAVSVEIIHTNTGKKDFIMLQPRAKVDLPRGVRVSNNFLVQNPKIIVREK